MKTLERVLNGAILLLLAFMIVMVTLQVINRYGIGLSLPWTEELARTAYVLLIFVGSSLAALQCNHVRVLSLVRLLPPPARRWLAIASGIASAAFFGFVAYGNWVYTVVNLDARFPTVQWLSIGHVIGIVLLSSCLSVALFLYRAFRPCETDEEEASVAGPTDPLAEASEVPGKSGETGGRR